MSKKNKIEINKPQEGLSNPFSSIKLEGLPPGPAKLETPAPEKKPGRKLGRVVLRKETAHRGGKTVIVVYDFESFIATSEIEKLGKRLKAACGTGGTVKDREIEIQGEQASKVRSLLEEEGFRVAGIG
ncbi:MAG: translation initiation factor Sui1 [Verrucomicrobiales bacterium]|nr:translation initiation factor Sui1 [Verrucomicrobiales bacterium]MDB6131180.1 translation initiation factor Sui1 [Verrucomicrobiales bacterium]